MGTYYKVVIFKFCQRNDKVCQRIGLCFNLISQFTSSKNDDIKKAAHLGSSTKAMKRYSCFSLILFSRASFNPSI